MYRPHRHLIVGFHVCEKEVAEEMLLYDRNKLKPSKNSYDWLGEGIYFWKNDLSKAIAYGKEKNIKNATILGAIIYLGHFLDLDHYDDREVLALFCAEMEESYKKHEKVLKENTVGSDKVKRERDCEIIEYMHKSIQDNPDIKPYDSLISTFEEGDPAYKNAIITKGKHIQICIRNPNCIKGIFRPLKENKAHNIPI